MLTDAFTARNVAKYIVTAIVQSKATEMTETALDNYTSLDTDSTAVSIGCNVVGWGVAAKLKPGTDRIVDTTADFVTRKREARNARKTAKKED